ncbi:hypothetical protein LPJ75_007047, partial [Coemansia sp. RSA 2598]
GRLPMRARRQQPSIRARPISRCRCCLRRARRRCRYRRRRPTRRRQAIRCRPIRSTRCSSCSTSSRSLASTARCTKPG